jgi:hypothetical protein
MFIIFLDAPLCPFVAACPEVHLGGSVVIFSGLAGSGCRFIWYSFLGTTEERIPSDKEFFPYRGHDPLPGTSIRFLETKRNECLPRKRHRGGSWPAEGAIVKVQWGGQEYPMNDLTTPV